MFKLFSSIYCSLVNLMFQNDATFAAVMLIYNSSQNHKIFMQHAVKSSRQLQYLVNR